MAGLQGLSSIIYHEKQQPGSMLCAQHALNSLLQGNYFTAPDLSDIARSLDRLEERYDDANAGRTSTNMDDTGFFSIQVLEDALNVWGLTLIRWRSETMRPYQDHPHTQLAFILNYQQHWYTLRRFGPATSRLGADAGEGHWFNLNSFLNSPEWVGKLYLSMVLQQAEKDGYSVFAVAQVDPTAHLALARTEADQLASTLPEPVSATPVTRLSTSIDSANPPAAPSESKPQPLEGFEDEDMELQAALQASLMGDSSDQLVFPPAQRPPTLVPSYATDASPSGSTSRSSEQEHLNRDVDPIAASLARNKVIMDRMRQEQEMAQRALYEEEITRLGRTGSSQVGLPDRTEHQGEDEMLMRAIVESQASARAEGHGNVNEEEEEDIDDVDMDADHQPAAGTRQAPRLNPYPNIASHGERVYDDDDAELQAALKASLENVPEGFTMPNISAHHPRTTPGPLDVPIREEAAVDEGDTVSEADTSVTSSEHPGTSVGPSVDEIRRMRLARFGS